MKKEQLGELILSSQDGMYHAAKALLRSDADCADAIQEAIVKAFSKLHTLRSDQYARTWLMRIVVNESYAILRRKKRLVFLEDCTGVEPASAREDYSELYEALCRLEEPMRLCVVLHYLDGYSVRETAAILGMTENMVKKRLMRARQLLREDLAREEECL